MNRDEYRALESVFLARTDALCENKSPLECDCPSCPCKNLCDTLCAAVDGGALI